MAITDQFLGISFEYDESISQFQGVTFELVENLIIKVVDADGVPVNGATVFFKIGQDTEEGTTNESGTVGFLVEEESTVTVSAQFECLFTDEVDILHGGIDDFRSITLTLQELPCLDTKPSNNYNFIRWFRSNNLKFPLVEYPIQHCISCNGVDFEELDGLQRPFDNQCKGVYMPIIRNGEKYSFFTNFDSIMEFANRFNYVLGIFEEGELNVSETYGLTAIRTQIQGKNADFFYSEFTPVSLENGTYRLAIYDPTNSNNILFISNFIKVDNEVDTRKTALIKYRNSDVIDGFQYDLLPEFVNQIRVNLFQIDAPEWDPDFEDENQVTNAEHRYISLAQRRAYPVKADNFDNEAMEALESFLTHNEIYVNGKRYNPEPEVAWEEIDLGFNKFNGRFRLFDYKYARKNKYGKL